jgi:uncharacterized membrane protein/predicted DsbA family dithiol-disulfide isomerase
MAPQAPPSRPREATARLVALLPVVTGLAASAALLVDYLRPVPVFCAEGSGCDAVRHTPFATPLGIPLPALGVAGFFVLGTVVLWPGRRARLTQVVLAAVAALAGCLLLALQYLLGHFCPYCGVADASGVATLAAASWWVARPAGAPASRWVSLGGAVLMGAAVGVPLAVGLYKPVIVPKVIEAEMARTPRGALTVVDFVDFECPFCRMTQKELEPVLEAHKDRLHLVRRQVPLRSHAHAHDAARAACCAEKLGKGDAMAASLFGADVEALTPEGCQKLAEQLGLPADAYRACVVDPSTDASIEADRAEFQAAGGFALPTLWIGRRQLVGAQSGEEITKAVDAELKASGG